MTGRRARMSVPNRRSLLIATVASLLAALTLGAVSAALGIDWSLMAH